MDTAQLQKLLTTVKPFVIEQGDRVLENWDHLTIAKAKDEGADVSTNFDEEIERIFYDLITDKFPEHGFQGEEFPELNKEGEYTWMIDPIDGSKFFAKGVPIWCTTVSLVKGKDPVLGVVYNPISEQLYTAVAGGGAYLNGQELAVTTETDLNKIQVNWDQSYPYKKMPREIKERIHREMMDVQDNVYRVRVLGSGTLAVSWIAQGFFGAYIDTYRPHEKFIDLAGALIIAQEAGAQVLREKIDETNEKFIIAPPEILRQLDEII